MAAYRCTRPSLFLFVVLCVIRNFSHTHGHDFHRAFSRRTAADCLHWNLTIAGYAADRAFATEVSLSPLSVIAHHREQSCSQVVDSSACRLITSATTGMYLLKEYAVVNDLRETDVSLSRLYRGRSSAFEPHYFEIFLFFLNFSRILSLRWLIVL